MPLYVRQIISATGAEQLIQCRGKLRAMLIALGIDAANMVAHRQLAEKLVIGERADFLMRFVEQKILPGSRPARIGPMHVPR